MVAEKILSTMIYPSSTDRQTDTQVKAGEAFVSAGSRWVLAGKLGWARLTEKLISTPTHPSKIKGEKNC